MTEIEHLLTILGEECNEVGQRCSKAKRFTLKETEPDHDMNNAERIMFEYAHLVAAVEMLQERGLLPEVCRADVASKKRRVLQMLDYSRALGTVNE